MRTKVKIDTHVNITYSYLKLWLPPAKVPLKGRIEDEARRQNISYRTLMPYLGFWR